MNYINDGFITTELFENFGIDVHNYPEKDVCISIFYEDYKYKYKRYSKEIRYILNDHIYNSNRLYTIISYDGIHFNSLFSNENIDIFINELYNKLTNMNCSQIIKDNRAKKIKKIMRKIN